MIGLPLQVAYQDRTPYATYALWIYLHLHLYTMAVPTPFSKPCSQAYPSLPPVQVQFPNSSNMTNTACSYTPDQLRSYAKPCSECWIPILIDSSTESRHGN